MMLRGHSASSLPEPAVAVEQFSAGLAGNTGSRAVGPGSLYVGALLPHTWQMCDSLVRSKAAQGEEGLWYPVPVSPERSLLMLTSPEPQWPRLYNGDSGADMRDCTAPDSWGQRIISLEMSIQRPGGNTTSAGLICNLLDPALRKDSTWPSVQLSVLCLVWPKAK